MFKNITGVETYLQPLVANANRYMKDNLTLERMWGILDKVGNPHERLQVVHVAGTSGKTSTCYYIAALLEASGKKVGLTVSPHVLSITERVQINMQPIRDMQFCNYFDEFIGLLGNSYKEQSYFECMIAFALWVFERENVDYVVLETGLGGMLDSTNVVTQADKVCVLTDIGYDHQHVLGTTLEQIATQKAGIIHENNHVLSYPQDKVVNDVYALKTKLKKASFQTVNEKNGVKYDGLAAYQRRNYVLALATANYLAARDGFKLVTIDPRDIHIPGRMQKMTINGKKLIVDGAHNPQKMQAFVKSIQELYPRQQLDIVLAMRTSKDYVATVGELEPIASKVICTEFGNNEAAFESVPTGELAEACKKYAIPCIEEKEAISALRLILTNPGIITGSLYILKNLPFIKN